MKRSVLTGVLIILAILAIALLIFLPKQDSQNLNENPQGENQESQNQETNQEETKNEITIEMTSSGFEPNSIEIQKGTKVIFENIGNKNVWPASAIHPTHTVYPNSGIDKCGTNEEENIFDACKAISPGETYEFTFNEIGSWDYHDHLKSNNWGTIIVN